MNNVQILTIVLPLATSFIAVLTGVLMNNTRLNDVKELLSAKIDKSQSQLQLLIEKDHSETMLKFAEMDNRLTRIEGERRIVQ
jgi:hypothetical protein